MLDSLTQISLNLNPKDPFRPKYHFSVPKNWLNDPNGMVYYRGEFHLFYQYYPDDIIWGPMHWGHAVSRDLINWEHLPIALYPDELGMIFSGSAVIDYQNTAGFGPEAMVAIFTHHNPETLVQSQSLAYSLDCGRSWTKYAHNPVLQPQLGLTDFRDPKVFWYSDKDNTGHWVMCLAVGTAVYFFTSPNLIDWQMSGRFGDGYGAIAGVWETPEIFKLPVNQFGKLILDDSPPTTSIHGGEDNTNFYWVLSVGVLEGGPGGGSGTQYFVGNFDGHTFLAHYEKETVLWADHGPDFYAVQSWSNVPNGRRLWLAWMNNWQYAKLTPATTWRGMMTLPREVGLIETANGPRIVQKPAPELEMLRGHQQSWQNITIQSDMPFSPDIYSDALEIIAEIELSAEMEAELFSIKVRVGDGEYSTIGYWTSRQMLFTDRFSSGQLDFHEEFGRINGAIMEPEDGRIHLHIFVDRCSVEVFGNGGQVCFSELIFPGENSLGIELSSEGGPVTIRELTIYNLN